MGFFVRAWTLAVPLTLLLAAICTLSFLGYEDVATTLSYVGTPVILLLNLAYIVLWDSRKRWPGAETFERLKRVVTFQR